MSGRPSPLTSPRVDDRETPEALEPGDPGGPEPPIRTAILEVDEPGRAVGPPRVVREPGDDRDVPVAIAVEVLGHRPVGAVEPMEPGEPEAAPAVPEVQPHPVAALEDRGEVGIVSGGDEEIDGPVAVEVEDPHRARPALGREPPKNFGSHVRSGRSGGGRLVHRVDRRHPRRGRGQALEAAGEHRIWKTEDALVALGHQGEEVAAVEAEGDRSRRAVQGLRLLEPALRPGEVKGDASAGMTETGNDEVAEPVAIEVGRDRTDRSGQPADEAGRPPVLPLHARRVEAYDPAAGRTAGREGTDQGDRPGAVPEGCEVDRRGVDGDFPNLTEIEVVDPHTAPCTVADEEPSGRLVDEYGGDGGWLAVGSPRRKPDREPVGGPLRRRGGEEGLRRRPASVVIENLRPVGERQQRTGRIGPGGQAGIRPPPPSPKLEDAETRPHLGEHAAGPRRAVEGGGIGDRVTTPAPRRGEAAAGLRRGRTHRPEDRQPGRQYSSCTDSGEAPARGARVPPAETAGKGEARSSQLSRVPPAIAGRVRSGRYRRARAGPRGRSPSQGTPASRPPPPSPDRRGGARRR